MNDARPVPVPPFLDLAVRHLQLIDESTPPQMVRLHSQYALTFLQLGLERELPGMAESVLTVVERGGQ